MTALIYSKTECPFCHATKLYLQEHQIPYQEVVYDDDQQRQQMYDELGLRDRQRTVPQIFIIDAAGHRTRIGGYTELRESGLIDQMAVDFNADF